MKSRLPVIMVMFILAAPIIYLAFVYNALPQQVPIHFSLDGKPDSYGNKSTFILLIVFMQVIGLGSYLLLTNLHQIDPTKAANQSPATMRKMGFAIVLLLTFISAIIISSAVNQKISFDKFMLPLLGLFFTYMGNLMYSVKPNFFVGIRTPWALKDKDNWRNTHQLSGKLWFAAGIVIIIIGLSVPIKHALITMALIIAVITIIPAIYSYQYFRTHKKY